MSYFHITYTHTPEVCPGEPNSDPEKINALAKIYDNSKENNVKLPFGLFALFPNILKALPKSGGWMTTIKVILGFLELALALKFLSNADLVAHWGFLKREVFVGIWTLLAFGLTLCFLYKAIVSLFNFVGSDLCFA
mgnify:CR=1 FL=1